LNDRNGEHVNLNFRSIVVSELNCSKVFNVLR